jgi:hypothetical protein
VADDAGALLVRSGLVSGTSLDRARALASKHGGTLGEHLVASGAITDDALTEFYRSRLLVPQVNPNSLAKLKTKVIQAIPADMAVELRAVPVAFDADGNLTVAMSDPSDRHAVDEITFFTGNYVVRAVATQMQIAWCLAHYYGHVTELGQRLLVPRDADEPAAGVAATEAAPAPAPAPVAPAAQGSNPAVPLPTRARGDTARVDAARHRVLAPVTVPPPIAASRPAIDVLDRSSPAPPAPPAPEPLPAPPAAPGPPTVRDTAEARTTIPDVEGARAAAGEPPEVPPDAVPVLSPAGRSRTASGEIRVAPVPAEVEPESSEEMEITISPNEEPTSPGVRMTRKRRTDPPELADRGGEIAARDSGPRTIADEPRVVIDLSALDPEREQPIELSGEIKPPRARSTSTPPVVTDEPSVKIALDDDAPAVIHDSRKSVESIIVEDAEESESAPILLERLRTVPPGDLAPVAAPSAPVETPAEDSDAVPAETADQSDTDVVLLESRRPKTTSERRRIARATQLGLGVPKRAPSQNERAARDTEVGGLPPGADMVASEIIMIAPDTGTTTEPPATSQVTVTSTDDAVVITAAAPDETIVTQAAVVPDETVVTAAAPPSAEDTGDTGDFDVAPPPEPDAGADDVTKPVTIHEPTTTHKRASGAAPDDGRTTDVYDAVIDPPAPAEPAAEPRKRRAASQPVVSKAIDHDAVDDGWGPPGTTIPPPLLRAVVDDSAPVAKIPIADEDSAPLKVAPAVTRTASPADAASVAKDLETAATRLVTVLRDIDQAKGRDEVIYNLINHLGETHNRAAFFAVKNGEIGVFSVRAPRVQQPRLTLSLDLPSTFQDVVGTRLPYRGPVVDEATREYLVGLLGTAPVEMLVLPIAVRDRVVGLLYADGRRRQTFDDHYAITARAAGLALERILKQKSRPTEPPPVGS